MNIVYTILAAFPIGFFVKKRGIAIVTYLVLGSLVFAFQSVSVVLDWLSDNRPVAFGASPTGFPITYSHSQFWGYGVLNLLVFVVGTGLTLVGVHVAQRRATKRNAVSVA